MNNNKEKKIDVAVMAGSAIGVVAGELIADVIMPNGDQTTENGAKDETLAEGNSVANSGTEDQAPTEAQVIYPEAQPIVEADPIEILANPTVSIEGSEGANVFITNNINLSTSEMGDQISTYQEMNGDYIVANIDEDIDNDNSTEILIDDSPQIVSSFNPNENGLFEECDFVNDADIDDYFA